MAHGGGRRCTHEGCTKSARSSTECCQAHGTDLAAEILLTLVPAAGTKAAAKTKKEKEEKQVKEA
jgi:hypothetical protein